MSKTAKVRPRTEIAPTFKDCIARIREQWGDDYNIVEKRQTPCLSFGVWGQSLLWRWFTPL